MIKAEWTNADALNLQPTCNQLATDCISRQDAIDVAKEELDNGTFYDIPSKIESLPSAQPDVPDRKVGKWIEEVGMLMCSECGDAWGTEQFDEVMSFNFCPNCGAKMEV